MQQNVHTQNWIILIFLFSSFHSQRSEPFAILKLVVPKTNGELQTTKFCIFNKNSHKGFYWKWNTTYTVIMLLYTRTMLRKMLQVRHECKILPS